MNIGSDLSLAGGALGAAQGILSGTPQGYAKAAIGGAGLAAKAGAFGSYSGDVGIGAGAAGGALGLYSGLQQGGVAGDTQAGLGAATLAAPVANAAGASALGSTLAAAGPISLALAPALIGMSTPAYSLTGKYWTNYTNTLQTALNSGDKNTLLSQSLGLLSMPQNQVPNNIQQLLWQAGVVPYGTWGLPVMGPGEEQIIQNEGGSLARGGGLAGKK